MAARTTTITVPRNTWTQLTDNDVASITFQILSRDLVMIKATTDTTAPTTSAGAVAYQQGQGERNVAMADLFPGLSGADRLWAFSQNDSEVMVSHA